MMKMLDVTIKIMIGIMMMMIKIIGWCWSKEWNFKKVKYYCGSIIQYKRTNLQVKYEQISVKVHHQTLIIHKDLFMMTEQYFCKDVKGLNNKTKLINWERFLEVFLLVVKDFSRLNICSHIKYIQILVEIIPPFHNDGRRSVFYILCLNSITRSSLSS